MLTIVKNSVIDLWGQLKVGLVHAWDKEAALFSSCGIFFVVAETVVHLAGLQDRFTFGLYPSVTISFLVVAFVIYASYVVLAVRPAHPIGYLYRHSLVLCHNMGWIRLILVLTVFTLFFSAISSLKSLIPAFNFFHWDPTFARLDAQLYGGVEPWRLLQPLVHQHLVAWLINLGYCMWIFLMMGTLVWQIFDDRLPQRRKQFLLAYCWVWIINGVVLATLLSSVGPCFYGQLLPDQPNPYAGMMEGWKQVPLLWPGNQIEIQNHLWKMYESATIGLGAGISAMPSLHVSIAWLLFLFYRKVGKYLGCAFLVYALMIKVGSIILGWHYSVDGYVAIIVTTLIWLTFREGGRNKITCSLSIIYAKRR